MSLRTRLALWFERWIVAPAPEGCDDVAVSNLDRWDGVEVPESLRPPAK